MTGVSTTHPASAPRAMSAGALLVAMLVVGLNFRAPITAVPPVLPDVAAGLGISQAVAGLLTGVPILCFALFAPVASWIIGRVGPYRAMSLAVGGVLVGTLVRAFASGEAGVWVAFGGTAVIGSAIMIGNVTAPTIVAHDFPRRAAGVTGVYTASLNLGSVFATTLTFPLSVWLGWQAALGAWSVMAVVALVWWAWVVRGRPDAGRPDAGRPAAAAPEPPASVLRRPLTWLLAVAFVGQSFSYFAVTGVLPELLGDEIGFAPAQAGLAASLFQGLAILGSLVLPVSHAMRLPIAVASAAMSACWLALPVGLLLAPDWWALWCSLAGLAQGGNFAVIFTIVAQRAGSPAEVRKMAATVQFCGYIVAFTGPTAGFAVHDAAGGWEAPLLLVLAVLLAMTTALTMATWPTRHSASAPRRSQ